MANKIQETNLRPIDGFVSSLSRYADSEVVYYGENNLITFKTYRRTVDNPTSSDRFMVISPGHEYRPDLVSREAYGTVDFWWQIMESNKIYDIWDFKAGRNIRLPGNVFTRERTRLIVRSQ